MVAEKAADLLRGNTPLAPVALPFYRRDRANATATGTPAASGTSTSQS